MEPKCVQKMPPSRQKNAAMTGPEFAAHVGISYRTALRMRQAGEGPPAYRVGRVWRYLRKDVDLWLSRLPTAGGTS